MHDVSVTVIAFADTDERHRGRLGDRRRAVDRRAGRRGSSRRPTPRPRASGPAEDAAELVGGAGRRRLARAVRRRPRSRSTPTSPPRWARRSAGPTRRGPGPLRLRRPRRHHDLPRLVDRAAAAARAADRPLGLHRQDRRPAQQRLGRRRHPRLPRRRRGTRWTPSSSGGSAGRARTVDLPAGRYDTVLPPTAVADLMIYAYWIAVGPRPPTTASRSSPGPAAAPGSASGSPATPVQVYSDPALRRACRRAPFVARRVERRDGQRLRQRPAARPAPTGSGTARSRRCVQTRETAALTGQPVTPHVDNLVVEVDGATGGARRPGRRRRARAAADLPVVHPRGRPADAAAHRADPRRRLPRRGRRDHRRGQQLPVQREPDRPARPVHRRLGDRAVVLARVGRLLPPDRHAGPAGPRLQHVHGQPGPVTADPGDARRGSVPAGS